MSNFLKNKKILISIISVLILTILIVGGIFLFKGNNKDTNVNKSETISNYVAYIKINPSIKLEYKQVCNNNKCDEPIVLKYELVNDDAKNIFKDIDLLQNDNTLYKVIDLITETTKNNNIKFDKVEIYSNWNNAQAYMNENSKNKEIYKVSVNSNEELSKISNQLLKNEEVKIEKDNVNQETNSPNKDNVSNNKNPNNSQKPSQNEVPKKDPEPTTEKEISPGIYVVDADGYGDYLDGKDVNPYGERRYHKFVSTSKLGCKDAIDKHACKEFWMNYFAPKVEEVRKDWESEKGVLDWYKSDHEVTLKKYDEYKTGLEKCSVSVEEAEKEYYTTYCEDAKGYFKYYEDRLNAEKVNIPHQERQVEVAYLQYKEHLDAYNIYKNLPY